MKTDEPEFTGPPGWTCRFYRVASGEELRQAWMIELSGHLDFWEDESCIYGGEPVDKRR